MTTENKESTFFFLSFSSWSSANVMAINAKIRKTLMPTTISNQLLENPTRKWSFKNATSQRTLQHLPTCAVFQRMVADYLSRMSWFLHFTSDNIFMPNTLYIHFYNGRIQSKAWKFIRRGKKKFYKKGWFWKQLKKPNMFHLWFLCLLHHAQYALYFWLRLYHFCQCPVFYGALA